MNKRLLSKSQANLFLDCPYKWKKCYIDKIRSEPSPAQERGIRIHSKIEGFYKKAKIIDNLISTKFDEELIEFTDHEERRLKLCVNKEGKFETKYFKPLFQELKMENVELGLKGIVDAVFINPADDGIVVIDWKTGKYYPDKFDDYRFELAVYSELLKSTGKVDNVKYWGIYFVDQNKTFFEEVKPDHVEKMYSTMDKVREGIKSKNFLPKKNKWCYFCQFKNECGVFS